MLYLARGGKDASNKVSSSCNVPCLNADHGNTTPGLVAADRDSRLCMTALQPQFLFVKDASS